MFVGQRAEGFAVNLGQIFDLVNMGVSALGVTPTNGQADLTGAADQGKSIIGDKNVTTLALEIPASCLTKDSSHPIIAGWTTSSHAPGARAQPDRDVREPGPRRRPVGPGLAPRQCRSSTRS